MKMANGSGNPKHRRKIRRRLAVERLGQRRVLAAIAGSVFEDLNFSAQREVGEPAAPRRLVYIDANDNSQLDNGEQFVVGEADGSFQFDGLADGTYLLRLFNGTSTQIQTTPLTAQVEGSTVSVTGAGEVLVGENGLTLALTDQTVVVGDTASGTGEEVPVGQQLTKMQNLPDGRLLVVGSDAGSETSWVVDPASGNVTAIHLAGGASIPWSELAIDATGRGVLLDQSIGQSIVRSVDATNPAGGITTSVTSATVPTDTQVLTSQTGSRSVFAWNGANGLEASLWSNVTDSFITDSPTPLSGTTGLLSFDDASGLLAVRSDSGGVNVYDANANFAALHSLDNVSGPVAIDGARDLLFTISPLDAMLRLFNLRNGAEIADLAIDLSAIGSVASLALNDSSDGVVVLGAAGLAEVALNRLAAHEVTIHGGADADPVLFGVALNGANTAPRYGALPDLETKEDTSLSVGAPGARTGSFDAQNDQYVLVQLTQASNGSVDARFDGSLQYTPRPDYNGTDTFTVMLHDGRDASDVVELSIEVLPVPDAPQGVDVIINPIPENLPQGTPVGTIEIIDADGGGHTIVIDDDRFAVQGGEIIFVDGEVDFEEEPFININVTVTDPETSDVIEEIYAATVRDENDPITDITPHTAEVRENAAGELVTFLEVHDQDGHQTHTLVVDDDRFEIVGEQLRLKNDIALDFEKEETVVVNVTATEDPNGNSFTQAITISVKDVVEQPGSIELSKKTVLELHAGDVVGEVTIDGRPPNARFDLLVDDPRFEIVDGTLKLHDDQVVERSSQSEIELSIAAVDTQARFDSISETFIIEVLENSAPFHNHENPYDVDHSGRVSAIDALVIINFLNSFGPGPVGRGNPAFCYDVNADSLVTALDALLVLNELARIENGAGTVGGEPEAGPVAGPANNNAPNNNAGSYGASAPEGEFIPSIEATQLQDDEGSINVGDVVQASQQSATQQSGNPQSANQLDATDFADETSAAQYAQSIDETIGLMSDES